jgi:hypothetical protein
MMRSLVLLFALLCSAYAVEVPAEILAAILKVETRSEYKADGSIRYVDKRRGTHGERGAFQMTKIAFNQIKNRGEQFWMIETDPYFAELCAKRYLVWLYENSAKRNWSNAIQQYNAGPNHHSPTYLAKVSKYLPKGIT